MGTNIVATLDASTAGILVYWNLSGNVDSKDVEDALRAEGLDPEEWLPTPPTNEEVLKRAAEATTDGKRQMVRPLQKRGEFAIVTEKVVRNEKTGKDQLRYEHNVLIREEDGRVRVLPVREDDIGQANMVVANVKLYTGLLMTTDISKWLMHVLERKVKAVGLRERGGFYFIPRDEMADWQRIVRVIRTCSHHKLFEIPAMKTDEAVEAILTSLRAEAAETMRRAEEYLAGEVSNKGLNSWEKKLAAVQEKAKHYADLLGVALPDLVDKSELLLGAVGTTRLMTESQAS